MKGNWKEEIAKSIADAAQAGYSEAMGSLCAPKGGQADFCSTLAFAIAKKEGKNPSEIAKNICKKIKLPKIISRAEGSGPYVNFYFSPAFWKKLAEKWAFEKNAGMLAINSKKALVEFASVNPNKPWHAGHLRNALLGDSISRMLGMAGWNVERLDYIDDLGLQVAQSVWGIENLPAPKLPESLGALAKKKDHIMGWQYVEVAKLAQDPVYDSKIRKLLHSLEQGESKEAAHARKIVEEVAKAQYETALSFGITYDVLVFESDVMREIFAEGIEKIKNSGALIYEQEGKNAKCWVAKLEGMKEFSGMENADKILIRSDGTATYTGKDVAFQMWKFGLLENNFAYEKFCSRPDGTGIFMTFKGGEKKDFGGAELVVNVIGMEQSYPQKVIAALMRKMGNEKEADNSIHLAHEHVVLPKGRFSGREGNWMGKEGSSGSGANRGFTADELLLETVSRAKEKIKGEYSSHEKEEISRAVAIAAIRFSFLRTSASQKIVFDYDKALSLAGDSGPYVQYAYARAEHIMQKAKGMGVEAEEISENYEFNLQEMAMLRLMLSWEELLSSCSNAHQVHPICDFAIDFASAFNKFYTTTPVLGDDAGGLKGIRLSEVIAAKNMLGMAMDILGIGRLEKM